MQVGKGEVFSRKDVTETSAKLTERLGTEGYAFANVNAVPEIDDASKSVKAHILRRCGKTRVRATGELQGQYQDPR